MNSAYNKIIRSIRLSQEERMKIERLIPEEFKSLRDQHWTIENVERIGLEHTEAGHNKYYTLSQPSSAKHAQYDRSGRIFSVAYGAIGASPRHKNYNSRDLNMWNQMIKKLEKGYHIKTFKLFNEASTAYEEFMKKLGDGWELLD